MVRKRTLGLFMLTVYYPIGETIYLSGRESSLFLLTLHELVGYCLLLVYLVNFNEIRILWEETLPDKILSCVISLSRRGQSRRDR